MELLAVKTATMTEEAVLAEVLTMIGGDDDHGMIKHTAMRKLVHQRADLSVDVADTVIVCVAQEPRIIVRHVSLWSVFPIIEQSDLGWRLGASPEVSIPMLGRYIGRVGIKIIQECEKRTAAFISGKPVQKIAIDLGGRLPPSSASLGDTGQAQQATTDP